MKGKKYGAARFNVGTKGLTFYLILIAFFLSIVVVSQRNYNDVWILDGIFIPTLMFVFIFSIVETFVRSNQKTAILVASFLVVLNLIPGLKYQLFYNTYDTTFHFGFTNELSLQGRVPETADIGVSKYYSSNPGSHILISSISLVSGISINEIFRFVIPAIFGLTPLIVFFITKNVLANKVQRYCIVASAFPVTQGYIITGTSLNIMVYFLFFAIFLRNVLTGKNNREYTAIFIILSFVLVVSHPVTPLVAALLLMGMPLGLKTLHALSMIELPRRLTSTHVPPALLHLVLLMTWWTTLATADLITFGNYIKTILSPTGFIETPVIPSRFFGVPLWAQLRILSVFNLHYVIIGALSLVGLLVFLRRHRQKKLNKETKSFYMHVLALLGIMATYLLFAIGFGSTLLQYQRFLVYSIPFCIFFIGLVLWRLNMFLGNIFSRITVRNLAFASMLFVLISFSLIQFFPCQPFIPKASVLAKDLPENEYLVEVQLINTVYQKEVISFAEKYYSKGRIASDVVTRWQIDGFSDRSFYSRLVWHNPLEPNQNQRSEWDLFLLHTRKAGPFNERVEYRTMERIEHLRREAGNLVYDNGESFIISHVTEGFDEP